MPRTKASTFSRRGSASRSAALAFARCSCSRKYDITLSFGPFCLDDLVHKDHNSEMVLMSYRVANSLIVRRPLRRNAS